MVDVNVGTTEKVLGGVLLPPVWDGGDIAKMLVVFWCNFPLTDLGVVLDPLLHRVLVEFHQTHLHELRKDHLPPPSSPRNWESRAKLGYRGHSHLNPSKPEPPHVG